MVLILEIIKKEINKFIDPYVLIMVVIFIAMVATIPIILLVPKYNNIKTNSSC
ncbi:hypothetical protein 15D039_00031 [Fowlpox virus]|uniref:Uncharacterized protein n=1 Tax=Fowlpox virus TaxID=10261 RepID=A0A891LX28_FOWPV|nr:hypothetical protein [Fowlpox virus]UNS14221.1 ALPV-057 [Albatrosspox virus]WPD91055.1 hypothetical protein PPV_Vac110-(032-033)n2 [Avipoxvirus sp.]UQT20325.1 hypothetical protein [Fowlpox virus]UQT20567.1 hypothetical protein [Fowlpox virus]